MKKLRVPLAMWAAILSISATSFAADSATQKEAGRAIITVLPAGPGAQNAQFSVQNLAVKVNGRQVAATGLTPLRGGEAPTEIVLLIDDSARSSLGTQWKDLTGFVNELSSNTKVAIAYMENGRAVLEGPLSADPAQVKRELRLPMGVPGQSASPYFCLSDLAGNWPSSDPGARRVVIMITDGVDGYDMRYDPYDPYVQAAIRDSVKAGLQVYSIYWRDSGIYDQSFYENYAGQNLLVDVTAATGGISYWQGTGNPQSFEPFFNDLRRRLRNQYALSFTPAIGDKPELARFELKSIDRSAKIEAPRQVWIGGPAEAGK
jgi:hypothetical protein